MWIGFTCGWILGSISLYLYMFITAKEAPDADCVECNLPECSQCPYQEQPAARLAA